MAKEILCTVKYVWHEPRKHFWLSKRFKKHAEDELMRCYNMYANKVNAGITDRLNKEWESRYPSYFEDNKDKHWTELVEYNRFMRDAYYMEACVPLNEAGVSDILELDVKAEEVNFIGKLKRDPDIWVEFFIKLLE